MHEPPGYTNVLRMGWGVKLLSSHLLLMVGDYASDKVRIGISEGGHQIC